MKKNYLKPLTQVYDIQCSGILCMSTDEPLYHGPFGQLTDRDKDRFTA